MDITATIAPLTRLLVFYCGLPPCSKTACFKGMVGEWFINLCIRLFLDKREPSPAQD